MTHKIEDPLRFWPVGFYIYDIKKVLISRISLSALKMANAPDPLAFVKDLVLGGTSGVIAKTICAPLERVKILLQVGNVNTGSPQYKGMMDALIRVPQEQGVAALWRGNLSNCMRYFPVRPCSYPQ